jgi:CIC family chloride channel protein
MACVLGAFVSLAAIAFVECIKWLSAVLLVSPHSRIQINNPFLLAATTIIVPLLGGLAVGTLIDRFSAEKRPLGPPDVIKAVQLRNPLPPAKEGLVSTVASLLSLGCGASVGQYGPLVYLGAIAGGIATRMKFGIPNLQAIAIACGVAAAISTAFNAPIAGLVFAHEVILRHYSLQAFAPTTVASATGYVVANIIFERPPLFLVDFDGVNYGYEFALFAVLGIGCAVLAVVFMKTILWTSAFARNLAIPARFRPAIAGLIVGLVALELPDVLGIGEAALRFATIEGAFENWELALLVVAKLSLTAICIGFGFAGGVFSPSLLIGILFGALFWTLLELSGLPNSGIAVYAICGMMALTSPVIGAPLTTILIVFELTRNYDLTIAAMVGVVFANLLAYRAFGRSLFDVQLARNGIDLSFGRDRAQLEHAFVVNQSMDDYLQLSDECRLADAVQRLVDHGQAEAVVVDSQQVYQGVFRIQDAIGRNEATVADVMQTRWRCFSEKTSLWEAMQSLDAFVGEAIPIVESTNDCLIGMITEGEIIAAYLKTVHRLREEENEAI